MKLTRSVIWTVVALVGGYIFCQVVADVAATKIVQLGSFTIPAGTFVFTITFTLRDMLHKRLGREWARAAIVLAGVFNVIMALYLRWMAGFAAPEYYGLAEAWSDIFAIVPSIVIGSITAEIVSELIDTEVYHLVRERFSGPWQFMRVIISNAVSLPIDSLIFGSLAFAILPRWLGGDILPWVAIGQVILGQIMWKAIVTVVSLPGIYLVEERKIV